MKTTGWIIALGLAVSAFAADATYKGYLTDTACANHGQTAMDGADLKNDPGGHTVACQIACAKGGYGLMVQEGKTYKFMPFAGKGNELASALLKNTKKTKGLFVEVTGFLNKGAIEVSNLKEASM